jgi:hypothetical protein
LNRAGQLFHPPVEALIPKHASNIDDFLADDEEIVSGPGVIHTPISRIVMPRRQLA